MNSKIVKDYAQDYTDPDLRFKLKEKIKKSSKGGKPGEWSARKSQLLKHEYESHGGNYKYKSQISPSQKSLKQWTSERWETIDKDKAIRSGKTTRYLPHEIWKHLTSKEKEQAIKSKENGSRTKQNVANPSSVREKVHKYRLK